MVVMYRPFSPLSLKGDDSNDGVERGGGGYLSHPKMLIDKLNSSWRIKVFDFGLFVFNTNNCRYVKLCLFLEVFIMDVYNNFHPK